MKITAKKPSPPKARKTAGLKVKKVSLKAKNDASLRPKKLSATKFLALDKTDDGQFHKKAMQKRKALKDNDGEDKRGVIVLSNIPHGFFEGEMARYFRQFGVLEDIKLVRSKKTGQSCGFAYVEFQHYEVAQIVAKHMDGYLTFDKIMKCKVVPPAVVTDKLFKGKNIRPDNCPKLNMRKGAIRKLNKQRTDVQIKRRTLRLKSNYGKKIKKLHELGIELPLQALLGTQQQSDDAVEGQAINGHITTPAKKSDEVSMTLPEDATDEEPSRDISPDLTLEQREEFGAQREELATQIMSHLVSAKKLKTPKKSGGKSKPVSSVKEKLVMEVDESDDEVVLKTPPNAVKKYVKMGSKSTPTASTENKTPKAGKGTPKAAKITPESVKETPKLVKGTPKLVEGTPKLVEGTPKLVKGTPKLVKGTPKLVKGTPKAGKGTPKAAKMTPETGKETPKSATKTRKSVKGTSKVTHVTPRPVNLTPEEVKTKPKEVETSKEIKVTPKTPKVGPGTENVTPKTAKKTPKAKKMTSKTPNTTPKGASNGEIHDMSKVNKGFVPATQTTPKTEEASAGETQKTPKKGKKTPINKKQTPVIKNLSMENDQNTPACKPKTPKAKKLDVNENGEPLGEEPSHENSSAAASLQGKELSSLAKKLTPKGKKRTPKGKREAIQVKSIPSVGMTPTLQVTPGERKEKTHQTSIYPQKVTPGRRKLIEVETPVSEVTPSKKKRLSKATPGKTVTSSPKTPKKTPKLIA